MLNSETGTVTRRAGGRAARKALRSAPLAAQDRPVRPGLTGGKYRPLSETEMDRIYATALQALDEIGLADAPASGISALKSVGARYCDDGRIRIPAHVVEAMLDLAARNITLHAGNPEFDLDLSGSRVHYGTAGAAVQMVDGVTGAYRESTLQDLFDAARIMDTLDNIHFFQRCMVARDIEDNLLLDLNTIYACAAGTGKHIGTSYTGVNSVLQSERLLHLLVGGEEAWRTRPIISNSNCFVVPPMKFATESCEVMEACISMGMPVLLLSAGQAGATAPAALAGALVQAVAECLAGVVYVNAVKPGHPAIFGTWPFVSDLRTGAMSGGSGEQALLTAACSQMHSYLGLPGGAAAGMSDSKRPDMQTGWEQATSNVLAGVSGLNMVYESVGMHASLLGFCHESLILGDDMIGQSLRCVRGIEVDERTLSLDVMRSVCLEGPGHYLGHADTLGRMERDYIYPHLADRTSPGDWIGRGSPDLVASAAIRKNEILARPNANRIDSATDTAIRSEFEILLSRQ